MIKKITVLLLVVSLVAVAFMSCSQQPTTESSAPAASSQVSEAASAQRPEGGWKIGYTSNYLGNSWRTQYQQAVESRFKQYEEKGIVRDFTFVSCNSDVTEQLNQLNTMLQEDYDIIMVDAVSAASLTSVIDEANKKGIKIMLGNTICAYEGIPSVTADLRAYADIEASWLSEKLNHSGNILEIYGVSGQGTCALFEKYAHQVFDQYDIKTLAKGNGMWSDAESQKVAATMLSTYGDQVDGIFCEDGMTMGIVNAFLNADEQTVPVGGDYFKTFIDYWNKHPELKSIIIPNSPFATGTAMVDVMVYMLDGYEFQADKYAPNPLDESIQNWIPLTMPCVVVSDEDKDAAYLKKYPDMKILSVADAAKTVEGKEETAAMEIYYDNDYIASLFGLDKSLYW